MRQLQHRSRPCRWRHCLYDMLRRAFNIPQPLTSGKDRRIQQVGWKPGIENQIVNEPRRGSNPHGVLTPQDFKSCASAYFATRPGAKAGSEGAGSKEYAGWPRRESNPRSGPLAPQAFLPCASTHCAARPSYPIPHPLSLTASVISHPSTFCPRPLPAGDGDYYLRAVDNSTPLAFCSLLAAPGSPPIPCSPPAAILFTAVQ